MKKLFWNELVNQVNFKFKIEKCPLLCDFLVHSHDFSELVIILKGTALHRVNEREYELKPGDAFIIHDDLNHGYRNVRGLEYINIMFDWSVVQQFQRLKKMKGFQALFFLEPFYRKEQNFGSKLNLTPSQLRKAEVLSDILLEEYRHAKDGYEEMISSYFTALLIILSRSYSSNMNEDHRKVLQMAEAVTYIEENYLKAITLEQLSKLACISSRHFVRVFHKNYGITPMDYVIQLRLNHATKLLKESSLSITRIAMESGFNDHNYFSRQFKKVFTISASDYRKTAGISTY